MNKEIYQEIIEKAFPQPHLKEFIENVDDVHQGFDICTKPGMLINFYWNMENPFYLYIKIYRIASLYGTTHSKLVWSGGIPGNSDNEPDIDFMIKLLVNHESLFTFESN